MAKHYPGGPRSSELTKLLILDAAERICARGGIEALSIRTVCDEAEVNVAAINYHFGSKQKLLEEMFMRRVMPLNEERLRLLDLALSAAGDLLLENVIRSFIGPVLRGIAPTHNAEGARIATRGNTSEVVTQFLASVYTMQGEAEFLEAHYEPVRSRFVLALQRCRPELTLDDLLWRYNIMVGGLILAMAGPARMTRRPMIFSNDKGRAGAITPEESIDQMTAFFVAGFLAPAAPTSRH